MLAISTRHGDRHRGTITVTLDGIARLYAYREWREAGITRANVEPHPDNLPAGPLTHALSGIARDASGMFDPGPLTWRLTEGLDGWSVELAGRQEVAA
jgi:hypothetical protein